MKPISCCGIIPARYASSRFPGKPLADILGKPMFWHVYEQAGKCPLFSQLLLATDDQRIGKAAESLSIPFVLTSPDHQSGSDRVYEAALKLGLEPDTVVVNIQGDEPVLDPAHISALLMPFFEDPLVKVATLAHPVSRAEAENPNKVKIALADNNNAIYFSRSLIPYAHNPPAGGEEKYFAHIGLYAYTLGVLERFTRLPQSSLELKEGLEQLRFLEHNIQIRVVIVNKASQAVDIPEDITKVEQILLAR